MRFIRFISIFAVLLLTLLFISHWYVERVGQPVREMSKMIYVKDVLSEAMDAYYKEHGRYPKSSRDLPLENLRWGMEGSSARDVDAWTYSSDGKSFSITWKNSRYSDELRGMTRLIHRPNLERKLNLTIQ